MATPDPHVRISNAEREAVIGRLRAATEEGRLELGEFAERSEQVYAAKTFAEVERLLTDLPQDRGALAVPTGGAVEAAPDLELTHSYTRLRKEGRWKVPARIVIRPNHGRTILDCRNAEFTSREVEVALELKYSGLEIILPEGATAVDENVQLHGGRILNGSRDSGDGPRIRLTGLIHYTRVRVRYERRFLWWRW